MPRKPPLTARDARSDGPSDELPDLTVHLHFDDYRGGIFWPVADYEEKGFFTAEQKDELASRFDFSPELVSNLSLYVGNTLDIDSLMNLTRVSRIKAVDAAKKELRRAVRHAGEDAPRREKLVEALLACDALFAKTRADAAVLGKAQSLARTPECSLTDLLEGADAVLARPSSAAILAPADARKIQDGRRQHIVRSCCYVWREAERPLTYTTHPFGASHQRRSGLLFDLIRGVMRMVLPNGKHPSDETIRKDIDRFQDLIQQHPELLDGH